jgi:hypothetical protein
VVSCWQLGLPPFAIRQRGEVRHVPLGQEVPGRTSAVTYELSMNKSVASISFGVSCQSMAFMTEPVGVTTRLSTSRRWSTVAAARAWLRQRQRRRRRRHVLEVVREMGCAGRTG